MKKTILSVIVLGGLIAAVFLFSPWQARRCETAVPAADSAPASGLQLVKVPAGSFEMGGDYGNAQPKRTVKLSNEFLMSKFEITNQQFVDALNYAFAKGYLDRTALEKEKQEARGVSKSPQKYQDVSDEDSQIRFSDGKFSCLPGKEQYPIVEVTWYGAAFFCNMLSEREGLSPLYNLDDWSCQVYGKNGYRLPTEAEWEYAASFDDNRLYPWGNDAPPAGKANVLGYARVIMPVGSFPASDSKLGISDLAGNVAEMCNDWYYDSYEGAAAKDPIGPGPVLLLNLPVFKEFRPMKVVRGGSYLFDADFRKGMGAPFIIDWVVKKDSITTRFRSFDYRMLSRDTEGFRVIKTVATPSTQPARSIGEK